MAGILKDVMPFKVLLTESSQDPNKLLKVRGVFQKYNERNANNRVYEKGIFDRILSDAEGIMKRINERAMVGELEHPADGQTDLKRVSHVIVSLTDDSKGNIVGEAEILNTPHGKVLKALFEGGVQVGVSSRGSGSVTERDGALYVNADDYVLETFDFVYNNSVSGANPTPVTESGKASKTRTESKEGRVMSSKLSELRKLDLEIGRLGQMQLEGLSLTQRSTVLNQLIETRVAIDAATVEDPSVRTFAAKLHKRIDALESAIEGDDEQPPAKPAEEAPKPAEGEQTPAGEAPKNENWEANYKALKKITEGCVARYKTLKREIEVAESKRTNGTAEDAGAGKRYAGLKAITEEIIRRYHALADISEELVKRAKDSKAKLAESEKRYEASTAIMEGLVERYKADTVKLFVAGAVAKHPNLAEGKSDFLKAKDVKEARTMIETKLGIKPKAVNEGDEEEAPTAPPAEGEQAPAEAPAAGEQAESTKKHDAQRMVEAARKTRANLSESRRRSAGFEPLPNKGATNRGASASQSSGKGQIHESVNVVRRARARKRNR